MEEVDNKSKQVASDLDGHTNDVTCLKVNAGEIKHTPYQDSKERLQLFLFGIQELVKKFKELNLQKKRKQLLLAQSLPIKNTW